MSCSSPQRSARACILHTHGDQRPSQAHYTTGSVRPEFRSLPGFAASRSREPRTVAWVSVPPVPCVPCLSQVHESGTKLFHPASLGPPASLMWPAWRAWPPVSASRRSNQVSAYAARGQRPDPAGPRLPPSSRSPAPGGDVHSERPHTRIRYAWPVHTRSRRLHGFTRQPRASSLGVGTAGAPPPAACAPGAPLRRALRTATSAPRAGLGNWILGVGWLGVRRIRAERGTAPTARRKGKGTLESGAAGRTRHTRCQEWQRPSLDTALGMLGTGTAGAGPNARSRWSNVSIRIRLPLRITLAAGNNYGIASA